MVSGQCCKYVYLYTLIFSYHLHQITSMGELNPRKTLLLFQQGLCAGMLGKLDVRTACPSAPRVIQSICTVRCCSLCFVCWYLQSRWKRLILLVLSLSLNAQRLCKRAAQFFSSSKLLLYTDASAARLPLSGSAWQIDRDTIKNVKTVEAASLLRTGQLGT